MRSTVIARPAAIAALAATMAIGACGGSDPDESSATPQAAQSCSRSLRTGDSAIRLRSGGLTRSARVHVPRGVPRSRRLPVVLVLHFAGGPARSMEQLTRFSPLADRERFIAVYPEAAGDRHFWTLPSDAPSKPDDVGFIRDLLDRLERAGCSDPERIYATGVSNGGGMAARLACSLADRIAAIAPVAGGYSTFEDDCAPSEPVSVFEIHGTGDRITPYDGRGGGRGAVPRFLDAWADRDGCDATPARRRLDRRVMRFTWRGCTAGVRLRHVRITALGHGWPGGTRGPIQGRGSDYPATREIWRFFEPLRRR